MSDDFVLVPRNNAPSPPPEKQVEMALAGYRTSGTNTGAALAAGVDESTLRLWRRTHPHFAAAVIEAIGDFQEDTGQLAANHVRGLIEAAEKGTPRLVRRTVKPDGAVEEIYEAPEVSAAILRMALTRWDPRYGGRESADGDVAAENTLDATMRLVMEAVEREQELAEAQIVDVTPSEETAQTIDEGESERLGVPRSSRDAKTPDSG